MDPQICRICLKPTATISLFDQQNGIKYSSKVMRCVTAVEIAERDGLPSHICVECLSELTVSYEFVQKCEASDNALRCLHLTKTDLAEADLIKLEFKEECDDLERCLENVKFEDNLTNDEPFSYEETSNLKSHKKSRRKKDSNGRTGPVQCTTCGLMVNSPSAMKIHIRTHTGEKPFNCAFCERDFPTKGAMKRHTETFHTKRERKFTCETCGSSFYRKNEIVTHMRRHTGERPHACPYCPKRFLQISSLIRHKRIHSGDRPYPCPVCNKRFNDKSLVNKHMLVHTDEKRFTCHLCNKAMKTRTSLNTHITHIHSNEKTNVCNFCGMAFSMKGNLKTHMRRIHSEKSGECSVCLKTFADLAAHMRKHTGEKPFICAVCNKAFGIKRSLANHVLFKHQNSAKYRCTVAECTRSFPTYTMLEFHLLKHHTNHTPYVCEHCSRGFYRTSDLSRHLRVTHMDLHLKMADKSITA